MISMWYIIHNTYNKNYPYVYNESIEERFVKNTHFNTTTSTTRSSIVYNVAFRTIYFKFQAN